MVCFYIRHCLLQGRGVYRVDAWYASCDQEYQLLYRSGWGMHKWKILFHSIGTFRWGSIRCAVWRYGFLISLFRGKTLQLCRWLKLVSCRLFISGRDWEQLRGKESSWACWTHRGRRQNTKVRCRKFARDCFFQLSWLFLWRSQRKLPPF